MANCGVAQSWQALDAGERKARCRALAALAHVFAGHDAATPLILALRAAEHDPTWLADSDQALDCLPALPRRRMLAVLADFCHVPR